MKVKISEGKVRSENPHFNTVQFPCLTQSFYASPLYTEGSPGGSVVNNPPARAGDVTGGFDP